MCDNIKEAMNLRRSGNGKKKKLEEKERMKMDINTILMYEILKNK